MSPTFNHRHSSQPNPQFFATCHDLPFELLQKIVDYIESDPDATIGVDRRQYLSQESFRPPPPPDTAYSRAVDVGNFRLACRKFSEVGARCQFKRVTTRFSQKGFDRLDNIASQPHLAKHVKKFSYMVPYFYVEGRERLRELLPTLQDSLGSLDVRHFVQKLNEQKEIVASKEDLRVLKRALSAFGTLQHVQILRVQDRADAELLSYLRRYDALGQLVQLQWVPACTHSTSTLGAALLASKSPCSRFSSPMLSPQSAAALLTEREVEGEERINGINGTSQLHQDQVQQPNQQSQYTQLNGTAATRTALPAPRFPAEVGTLASKLTCLELHFDDSGGTDDLDAKMMSLSGLFKAVFTAAYNMEALHVGFPSHRPLSLRLEQLFHNVHFEKLKAFGIQAWRLDGEEVLALAQRHRDRLKGLRLRDVLLKENSLWRDVLLGLRRDMLRLDWVSLRRIGYTRFFDEQGVGGVEVPDDPPGGDSDSESTDSERDDDDGTGAESDGEEHPPHQAGGEGVGAGGAGTGTGAALIPGAPGFNGTGTGTGLLTNHLLAQHNTLQLPLVGASANGYAVHGAQYAGGDEDDDDDSNGAPSTTASSTPRSSASEHGPAAHELNFPPLDDSLDLPDTPSSVPWCTCAWAGMHPQGPGKGLAGPETKGYRCCCYGEYERSADELGDDGVMVTNQQRKMWEKWVVKKCTGYCCSRKRVD